MDPLRRLLLICLCAGLAGCATTPPHDFASPDPSWKTRVGQLQYQGPRLSLIGELVVRSSPAGDFQLTFSKGPAATLLTVRQDATHAVVEGPLARGRWAGRVAEAPTRLRGWLGLRDAIRRGETRFQAEEEVFRFSF